ncbi:MAG: DUF167 domain-containing protein [Nanobdellota archaeon]
MEVPEEFDVLVKTNAKKTKLNEYDDDRKAYRMDVKAPPEKGKANREIIRFIGKEMKKEARIMKGQKSKRKSIRLL